MGAKMSKMMTVGQAIATKDMPKDKRKPTGAFAAVNKSTNNIIAAEKAAQPDPIAPAAELVNLGGESGSSNFESELRRKRKKTRTAFAGDTGGYGGNTKLG